jgi:transcriptional regulator with XRE-family HTH domain
MDRAPDIQMDLFEQIRLRLSANTSFVHEIAELLGISYDSAYRRIRGVKTLDLNDLTKLTEKYNISIDALLKFKGNKALFDYYELDHEKFCMKDWVRIILEDTRKINEATEKQIIYAAKDPPIFQQFQFPEIAAFKMFVWQKTLFQFPEFENKIFSLEDFDHEIVDMRKQLLSMSMKIPTIEIWNEDTFNITLRQIEYYVVSGYFKKVDDVYNLCDKLEKWVNHIRKQAELGFKFIYGEPEEGFENTFSMYENEVVLNDNTILITRDNVKIVYLTFNTLSLLITVSPLLCSNVENYLNKLIRKSNLISVSGAKERNRFFNKLLLTISEFRKRMEQY